MSKTPLPEIDLVNRDPNNLNGYIQVDWQESFGEPHGTHSADCVWRNSYKCFTCSKNLCYKILTFILGIITAFFWGCYFACLAFTNIWCCGPAIRYFHIAMYPVKKFYSIFLAVFLAPLCEAYGMMFARIQVVQSQGPPPKPFGKLEDD